MIKTLTYGLALLCLLFCGTICFSQIRDSAYDFQPCGHTIFEDDFSHNTPGTFPLGWRMSTCNEKSNYDKKKNCTVQKEDDQYFFDIHANGAFAGIFFEPNLHTDTYLSDTFSLEFDILFEDHPGAGAGFG